MTAVYTWDVFSTLDGCGSYAEGADWGGYWGKQDPSCSSTAPPSSTPSSGWCSGPPPSGRTLRSCPRASIPTRLTSGTSGRCACTLDGHTQELVYRPTLR